MKRQERHHLKENPLAQAVVDAREYFETHSSQIGYVITGVVLVAVIALGVMLVRQRSEAASRQMLAQAMVVLNAPVVPSDSATEQLPASAQLGASSTFFTEEAKLNAALPALQAAADAYPDREGGVIARYHLAGALAGLGRNEEAAAQFAEVVQRSGARTLWGRMARMGQADSQARAGQLEEAIAIWRELADQNDPALPADAILIALARAYAANGNTEDARRTFTEIVDQHPGSPYSTEARAELETLKG